MTFETTAKQTLVILGCGDIGQRVAQTLDPQHYDVIGVKRRPPSTAQSTLPISWRQADVCQAKQLKAVLPPLIDVMLVTLTPSDRTDDAYRRTYVETAQNIILACHPQPPKLLMFISSTSVYQQTGGEWVDESSVTQPDNFNGRRLLEAEELLLNSHINTLCLRFSGIYGPDRYALLNRIQQNRHPLNSGYSNRIHVDDCAGVIVHLFEQHRCDHPLDSLYVASDEHPSSGSEIYPWLSAQMNVPTPLIQSSLTQRGKRCSSKKLQQTGYRFHHPSYRHGYPDIIKEFLAR